MALRRRYNELEAISGVGGAGLYSDGKFSYFPSATALWTLDPTLLTQAVAWLEETIAGLGIPFAPKLDSGQVAFVGRHQIKAYPSFYASLEQRLQLTEAMQEAVGDVVHDEVRSITSVGDEWTIEMERHPRVTTKAIILASGRFGPVGSGSVLKITSRTPRRLEVGVRIEQPSEVFFLKDNPLLDPKLIFGSSDSEIEWRTFCCCRDGEVVTTQSDAIRTHSGRGDCPATGRSNIGFLVRSTNEEVIRRNTSTIISSASRGLVAKTPLRSITDDASDSLLTEFFGAYMGRHLGDGLRILSEDFPSLRQEDTLVHVPCIEGVGWYPEHDDRLRTSSKGVWVAGDCTGSFRGIVAALISGRIAGRDALEEIDKRWMTGH